MVPPILHPRTLCLCIAVLLLAGCAKSRDQVARERLEVILADDLQALVADLPAEGVRDSVYYRILRYVPNPGGRLSAMAEVEFRVLKGDPAVVRRKYRYYDRIGKWERFYNQYHHTEPEAPTETP